MSAASKTKSGGKNSSKEKTLRGRSPSGMGSRRPCGDYLSGNCTNPSCNFWHPPECPTIFYSESGCKFGEKCVFRHQERLTVSQTRNRKEWWYRFCCLVEDFQAIWLRIPGYRAAELQSKSFGPKRSVQFSQVTLRHVKIRERRSPSQGVTQRSDLHEGSPNAPKFED